MAPALYRLHVRPAEWINRRVETISLTEHTFVRRAVSIDMTIPSLANLAMAATGAPYRLLPLALLKKRPLRNFDVRDAEDNAISLLGSSENAVVSAAVLRYVAARIVRQRARSSTGPSAPRLDPFLLKVIDRLVRASPGAWDRLWEFLVKQAGANPGSQCAVVVASDTFRSWADGLGYNFMMLVPVRANPGEHTVIKYAHDEAIPRWPLTADMRIGLLPASFRLVANPGGSKSYHVEITAPEELVVERATLKREDANGRIAELSVDDTATRVHLYTSDQPRTGIYYVDLEIGVASDGLLRAACVIGWITSLLLLVGAGLASAAVTAVRPDPATAIVVILPGVYAAFIAARAQNPLAERFLTALRGVILLFAACLFAAALGLVVHLSGVGTTFIWLVLGMITISATILVTGGWVRALARDRRLTSHEGEV